MLIPTCPVCCDFVGRRITMLELVLELEDTPGGDSARATMLELGADHPANVCDDCAVWWALA